MRLDSQLSRMNCQMFSVGFNSGERDGNGTMVRLCGTLSLSVVCHPGLVHDQNSVGAGCDRRGYFKSMAAVLQ